MAMKRALQIQDSFNDGGTRSRAPKAEVPDFKPHGGGMEALLGAIMMAEESM
eukprot:gene8557-10156_t